MLIGVHFLAGQVLAFLDVRQDAQLVVIVAVGRGVLVLAFLIDLEETVKGDDRAGRAQGGGAVGGRDIDGDLVEHRVFHLAGDRAFPDQVVELALIVVQVLGDVLGPAGHVRRAYGLVGFLRVLGFGLINTWLTRQIGCAIRSLDQVAAGVDGLVGHGHAVGSHIGDQADRLAADVDAFIKALRDLHGALGAEVQLARGFLLQSRRGERRRRIASRLLALNVGDGKGAGFDGFLGALGLGLRSQVHLGQLLPVQVGQLRRDLVPAFGGEGRLDGPEFLAPEDLDFGFALADQAQRDGLHAAGRPRSRQLAPQHRRQGEADKIIERAARQIGVDQFTVQFARMIERRLDRVLGDFVEHDALYLDVLERVVLVQDFADVPGNGLAFAVGVSREIQFVGAFDGAGDRLDVLFRPGVDFPVHFEVGVRAHGSVLRRQVTDMAIAGQHRVTGA